LPIARDCELGENFTDHRYVDNWRMAKRQISKTAGVAAIAAGDKATSVRYLLQLIETASPGGAVELRVPPFGAIQCIGGLDHRRGTPPNVVELSPENFLALALGDASWEELTQSGELLASGVMANELRNLFPLAGV
jgi:hypothetical protein